MPDTCSIGEPSKLPTQTPTVNSGVYPKAQLSRKSELVPVLHATGKSNRSGVSAPNARVRASLSLRISATKYAAPAPATLTPGCHLPRSPRNRLASEDGNSRSPRPSPQGEG